MTFHTTCIAHHGKGKEKREREKEKRGHDRESFPLHFLTGLLNISFTERNLFCDFDASLDFDRGLKTIAASDISVT